MGLNELAKEIHKNAVAHGWWETERSFPEIIALCHSELSEALEEYRNGNNELYFKGQDNSQNFYILSLSQYVYYASQGIIKEELSPEGIAIELADCIIRILDYCSHVGIDIDSIIKLKTEYNKKRPYRHGGKIC